VRYRRAGGTEWEDLDLDTAMEMIADRVVDTRARTWQDVDDQGRKVRRTLGFASLGGATLDNEENYLIKKLFTALGRCRSRTRRGYDTAPPSPVWGPRSVVAVPRTSCRTWRTLTASSSRARTWPSATRSGSSG
jgi:hypothetical protein